MSQHPAHPHGPRRRTPPVAVPMPATAPTPPAEPVRTPEGAPEAGAGEASALVPVVEAVPAHQARARSLTPEMLTTMSRASGSMAPIRPAAPRGRRAVPRWVQLLGAVGIPVVVAVGAHRLSTPAGFDMASAQSPRAPEFATAAPTRAAAAAADSTELPPPIFTAPLRMLGHSGEVGIRTVLPGDSLVLPYDASSPLDGTVFEWASLDGGPGEGAGAWEPSEVLRAPIRPGAYRLVALRGGMADTLTDFTWLVMRPMPSTRAVGMNGYYLGAWPRAAQGEVPPGFVEVTAAIADLQLTTHLRLQDFVVHDNQAGFPKYLYLRPALLDKLELVVQEIAKLRAVPPERVELRVASGFRSPSHNQGLSGSARDSRHMYGDAADIAIDVNADGRLTELDARVVALAAEMVEARHPDLVGGIGIYITTGGGGWPYVHIDVRGRKARWRGSRASSEGSDEVTNSKGSVGEVLGDSTPASSLVPAAGTRSDSIRQPSSTTAPGGRPAAPAPVPPGGGAAPR